MSVKKKPPTEDTTDRLESMDSPESQPDSPVTGQTDNDDRSDKEHDRPTQRSDKGEDDRFDAGDARHRSGGDDNERRSNARRPSEFTTEKTKPETNSAKIRQILKRTDSFDDAIKYPASKRQTESPVIVTTKPEMVTPDELFGPASPHWSDSKMADRRRSGEQGRRPKTRAQNSRLHATRRSSNDVETNKFPDASDGYSSPERKTYDEGKAKNHEPKTSRRKSSVNHGESPLRSVSRFESISRHEAGYDSSRTSDSTSRDDDKPIPTSRRHSRTGDTPATNRLYGSNTARIERDNHRLYDARTDKRYVPRYSPLSNRSSYNHGDIVDENLMISNPKLDITLLKLFAQSNSRSSSNNTFLPSVADGQEDFISMEPVMWRVHPMDAVHRETLDSEMAYITDNINPRDVVGELYRQHVLTHTDYNQLSRIENQGDRAVSRLMVKTLQRRGAGAYPAFLEVLQARGYPDVRERLLESEQSLKVGIRADKHGLKNYLMTPPRTRDRSTERTNDYTGLPTYPTLSSNPTVPATPLMMTTGQITPLFHNPYPYQMPMTFQMASPTYPMMANQGTNFGGARTPTPLDQIQFNQIERNLDYMRDELRALHEEMRDIKSNIKKGKQSPATLPSHNSGSDATNRRKYSEPELITSPKDHNTEPYNRGHPTEQGQPTNRKSPDVRLSQSDDRYPTHPMNSHTGNASPDTQKEYKVIEAQVLDRHLKDLHNEVKALHDDVTALSTARSLKAANDPGVTYINQPDNQKEAQARKLEKQLDDLHAQLRALRDDVTDLKSENNKRPNNVGAKTETPGSKAKGTPQYLSPQHYSSPVPPTRPVTRGANSGKENQPNSKTAEQSTHKPEGPRVRWSRDDTVYPIPKSDGGRKDSIRAFTPNGTRITEPSRILSPPAYNPRRGSKIMSPLTIFSDPSLPWPESARVKVKS